MDGDKIGLVLAKTADLRSKIVNSIQRNYNVNDKDDKEGETQESKAAENQGDGVDIGEEESLLNIKDALESLEGQLASLQDLQQQQWYERESALSEIELSQKKLLKELKNYKGDKHLQIIREAIDFASETEESSDLLLPPYPSRPSHSTASDNNYLSAFPKLGQNGTKTGGLRNINNHHLNNPNENENGQAQLWKGSFKGLIGTAAKAAFTVVGVIAILSLAGFEPRLKRRDDKQFKILDLFNFRENNDNGCPQGKVPVTENGETRCVVKERVEVPFVSVVATPDVSYGCG